MTSLRTILSVVVLALLAAGYIGSQYAYFTGGATQWAQRMDQPPIVWLALLVLVGAVVLSIRKEKA
ncbi:MAG TPA: hypothetical protein VHE55_16755 [Fimbriimonadaceae bacterium]|nr:hypothetical protein [Fimbriimonadaceae bacterium]